MTERDRTNQPDPRDTPADKPRQDEGKRMPARDPQPQPQDTPEREGPADGNQDTVDAE